MSHIFYTTIISKCWKQSLESIKKYFVWEECINLREVYHVFLSLIYAYVFWCIRLCDRGLLFTVFLNYTNQECWNRMSPIFFLMHSLQKMNHPNIIKLNEIVSENNELFFLFEYMVFLLTVLLTNIITCFSAQMFFSHEKSFSPSRFCSSQLLLDLIVELVLYNW